MFVRQNRCLFCLRSSGSFLRREHPIPESLGNDDLILPAGFVCDACNQYFGSKLEKDVLNLAPFGVTRASQCVKNKGGNYPVVGGNNLRVRSTGYWDGLTFCSAPPHKHLRISPNGEALLCPEWVSPDQLVRFLLKMGLELLVIAEFNPFDSRFDYARACARFGSRATAWDFAMCLYPDREDLVCGIRVDDLGELETRQIYSYSLGQLQSGDVCFFFMYRTMMFAVNLSRPPALEYIMGFNERNPMTMESRWKLFPRLPKMRR